MTKYRLLTWINKLKPFLDTHTSHYKDHYRYWTGLLLFVRIFIAILVSLNLINITAIPLLVITILTFLLTAIAWIGGGVYKTWPRNLLECSFFINLGILAVSTLFILKIGGNQEALTYTSGSIALTKFFGILVYHIYHQARKLSILKKWGLALTTKFNKLQKDEGEKDDFIESIHQLTYTTVGLREPLLDT